MLTTPVHESLEHLVLVNLLMHVVRLDFLAKPDLCVSDVEACDLWTMDPLTCMEVLRTLCREGFLIQTAEGLFKRP